MKPSDMLRFSTDSLRRRKGRTVLTVIGVVVGVCAILVMISLGIAVNRATDSFLQSWGDLRKITVYNFSSEKEVPALDDTMLEQLKNMDHVVAATPIKEMYSIDGQVLAGKNGKFSMPSYYLKGMDPDALEPMEYELLSGGYLLDKNLGTNKIPVLVGEGTAFNFYNPKKDWRSPSYMVYPEVDENGHIINLDAALFDIESTKLVFQMIYGYDDQGKPKTKEYELVVVGVMKSDMMNWEQMEITTGIIMSLANAKKIEKDYTKLAGSSGGGGMMFYGGGMYGGSQEGSYERIYMKVDEVKYVPDVEEQIKEIGYQTESMSQIREQLQGQVLQSQMMLGGLAAISLLVAALNIANTMTMSIYERTKEIGVMKVLGCELAHIRTMFLFESGLIGLVGGIIGILLSVFLSFLLNYLPFILMLLGVDANIDIAGLFGLGGLSDMMQGAGMRMSIIPWWLILFGLVFATLVGLLSGIGPANRAMRISSLEAIRHE